MLVTIIATHAPQPWNMVLQVAREERKPGKIDLLLSALTLVPHDSATEHLIQHLHMIQGISTPKIFPQGEQLLQQKRGESG